MNPIIKLYLKTFLISGVSFGLLMSGFYLIKGEGFELLRFLGFTLFFGITMSIILVSFHKLRVKKIGIKELTDDNLKANQRREVISNINKNQLMDRLKNDEILGKMNIVENEKGIEINSGMTWKSWGEKINITVKEIGQNEYEYQIVSEPKLKTTIVDYGKNLENVNRIEKLITHVA